MVNSLGSGTWIAPLSPFEARRFGQNPLVKGGRSIIAVSSPEYDVETRTLTVNYDGVLTLNIGEIEEAVLVDLNPQDVLKAQRQDTDVLHPSAADIDFIAACKSHLDEGMTRIIQQVLSGVRKHHDDTLIEGEGRKWIASPHNFMAITIQNRNKQFLVSVKARPEQKSFRHIHLKQSRPPYWEFHLNSPSQIEETIQAILDSANY
ncbi:MAG: hypothetical protein ACJAZW_000376 [Maritalea sp.]|jgi:hypothetical protein